MTTATVAPTGQPQVILPKPQGGYEPEIIPLSNDDDTFIIYAASDGWLMEVKVTDVIRAANGQPVSNPFLLAAGANVFRRAVVGGKDKTTCTFSKTLVSTMSTSIVSNKTIHIIPPRP